MHYPCTETVTIRVVTGAGILSAPPTARPAAFRRDAVAVDTEKNTHRRREFLETDGPATCLITA